MVRKTSQSLGLQLPQYHSHCIELAEESRGEVEIQEERKWFPSLDRWSYKVTLQKGMDYTRGEVILVGFANNLSQSIPLSSTVSVELGAGREARSV